MRGLSSEEGSMNQSLHGVKQVFYTVTTKSYKGEA